MKFVNENLKFTFNWLIGFVIMYFMVNGAILKCSVISLPNILKI